MGNTFLYCIQEPKLHHQDILYHPASAEVIQVPTAVPIRGFEKEDPQKGTNTAGPRCENSSLLLQFLMVTGRFMYIIYWHTLAIHCSYPLSYWSASYLLSYWSVKGDPNLGIRLHGPNCLRRAVPILRFPIYFHFGPKKGSRIWGSAFTAQTAFQFFQFSNFSYFFPIAAVSLLTPFCGSAKADG